MMLRALSTSFKLLHTAPVRHSDGYGTASGVNNGPLRLISMDVESASSQYWLVVPRTQRRRKKVLNKVDHLASDAV